MDSVRIHHKFVAKLHMPVERVIDRAPDSHCRICVVVSGKDFVTIPLSKEEWTQMRHDVDEFFFDYEQWNSDEEAN